MIATDIHQQQVLQGGTIRANKTWQNTGGAGYRDILAGYGMGGTLETFLMEFGAVLLDQYCAAGAQVTSAVDCVVPTGATPGLKNALVGVGEYDQVAGVIHLDDHDIVAAAIEVLAAAVSFTLYGTNFKPGADLWSIIWWNGFEWVGWYDWQELHLAFGIIDAHPLYFYIMIASWDWETEQVTYYPGPGWDTWYGPFSVEDGASYVIDVQIGNLIRIS